MYHSKTLPAEGDLYKLFVVDGHTFEIRYGYYEENERGRVEPLPVFPDLIKHPVYNEKGYPLAVRIQPACGHYRSRREKFPDGWCGDCIHYDGGREEMGRCLCPMRKRE